MQSSIRILQNGVKRYGLEISGADILEIMAEYLESLPSVEELKANINNLVIDSFELGKRQAILDLTGIIKEKLL